eukprot:TRINITY_DN84035_c0_g1_i1.p1 TRINITY_DN84035_c0_g1~~TRINITY_DN84035_c0_g1_i1.p1  ORF type:complete len:247 (-),score=63.40 TRINITY_DN84035_c0_g1_i1:13-711(-)
MFGSCCTVSRGNDAEALPQEDHSDDSGADEAADLWPQAASLVRKNTKTGKDMSKQLFEAILKNPNATGRLLARVVRRMGENEGLHCSIKRSPREEDNWDGKGTPPWFMEPLRIFMSSSMKKLRLVIWNSDGKEVSRVLQLKEHIETFLTGSVYKRGTGAPSVDTLMTIVTKDEEGVVVSLDNMAVRDETVFGLLVLLDAARSNMISMKEVFLQHHKKAGDGGGARRKKQVDD